MKSYAEQPFISDQPRLGFWMMFARPAATLESLRERPKWFLPLLVSAIYTVAVQYYVVTRIGLTNLVSKAARANAALDPEAISQNALAHRTQILIVQGVSSFLGAFATTLGVAFILWLLVIVAGADAAYKSILAVAAHVALFATVVKQSMLALTAFLSRNPAGFHLNNPLATNPAFFLHPGSHVAARLLSSLDLIALAQVALLVVGVAKVSRGLSRVAAGLVVVIPWFIYVGAAAWTASLA